VVYMAEQQEPIRRKVAFKVIKMFFILLATPPLANAGAVFLRFPVSLPV